MMSCCLMMSHQLTLMWCLNHQNHVTWMSVSNAVTEDQFHPPAVVAVTIGPHGDQKSICHQSRSRTAVISCLMFLSFRMLSSSQNVSTCERPPFCWWTSETSDPTSRLQNSGSADISTLLLQVLLLDRWTGPRRTWPFSVSRGETT